MDLCFDGPGAVLEFDLDLQAATKLVGRNERTVQEAVQPVLRDVKGRPWTLGAIVIAWTTVIAIVPGIIPPVAAVAVSAIVFAAAVVTIGPAIIAAAAAVIIPAAVIPAAAAVVVTAAVVATGIAAAAATGVAAAVITSAACEGRGRQD